MSDEADIDDVVGIGHNSKADPAARKQLLSVIERIERLEEEKKDLQDDIKEVYSEAKADGFDVKTLRKVIQLRKKPKEERKEEEALLELYMSALGML